MAYSVPNGAILEVQYRYTIQGQQCINVFHYKLDGSLTDAALWLSDALDNWNIDVGTWLYTFQTTDVQNVHVRGQFVYPQRYVPLEKQVGGGAGTRLPPTESVGTCLVLRKLSDRASRSARGRIYVGGVPQTELNIGTFVDAYYDAVLLDWPDKARQQLTDAGATRTAVPVIWSYSDPTNTDDITNGSVDRYCRYQRRREVGRGI